VGDLLGQKTDLALAVKDAVADVNDNAGVEGEAAEPKAERQDDDVALEQSSDHRCEVQRRRVQVKHFRAQILPVIAPAFLLFPNLAAMRRANGRFGEKRV